MPSYIIKVKSPIDHRDYYLIWSTIVDAPTTYGLLLPDFKEWYIEEYGRSSIDTLEERLLRVEKTGCSGYPPFDKIDSYFDSYNLNRDEKLTKEQIIIKYCHPNES